MLSEFALLLAPGNRARAYLQLMSRHNVLPSFCIIMRKSNDSLREEAELYERKAIRHQSEYFDEKEPILYTLDLCGVPYEILEIENVNDPMMLSFLKRLEQRYIIYSGFSGQILKKPLLNSGKQFIHIHPGILPHYRGSTTIYYSLLGEGNCGATAILLDEAIDQGEILESKLFTIPQNVPDVDHIYDPYIRASLLVEVLKKYQSEGGFYTRKQGIEDGETYFIIHPVLKHIAILSEVETKRSSCANEK